MSRQRTTYRRSNDLTLFERVTTTIVYAIAGGGSVALIIIVRMVLAGGVVPIMAVLLMDLLGLVAIFFLLSILSIWFPQFALWEKLLATAERHLTPIAIVAFAFVMVGIVAGVGFALGWW